MGVRENKVEKYMEQQVLKLFPGSVVRAWKKSNVIGVMDQILFIPFFDQVFVEVKSVGKLPGAAQRREAKRLTEAGALVTCVVGEAGVDKLLACIHLYVHNTMQRPFVIEEVYK